jgi:hypothetical protein
LVALFLFKLTSCASYSNSIALNILQCFLVDEFIKESNHVLGALVKRIEKEDNQLYPMFKEK